MAAECSFRNECISTRLPVRNATKHPYDPARPELPLACFFKWQYTNLYYFILRGEAYIKFKRQEVDHPNHSYLQYRPGCASLQTLPQTTARNDSVNRLMCLLSFYTIWMHASGMAAYSHGWTLSQITNFLFDHHRTPFWMLGWRCWIPTEHDSTAALQCSGERRPIGWLQSYWNSMVSTIWWGKFLFTVRHHTFLWALGAPPFYCPFQIKLRDHCEELQPR